MHFQICPNLHAMSDIGYTGDGSRNYSKPHTNNAECYATKCGNRGRCLVAVDDDCRPINSKTILKKY